MHRLNSYPKTFLRKISLPLIVQPNQKSSSHPYFTANRSIFLNVASLRFLDRSTHYLYTLLHPILPLPLREYVRTRGSI